MPGAWVTCPSLKGIEMWDKFVGKQFQTQISLRADHGRYVSKTLVPKNMTCLGNRY